MTESHESATYEAGCHCGDIRFSVTLSPPLEADQASSGEKGEAHEVLNCNCSICRRTGYLLIYPEYEAVTWHDGSKEKCGKYQFNTKTKDHLFCKTCGCSIGIDFREALSPKTYGISARTIDGIDLDALRYKKLDGVRRVSPAEDLSGGRGSRS